MSNKSIDHTHARAQADEFLSLYCALLDEGQLEDWCNLFADSASYRILSRENVEQKLPGSILLLETRASMLDRVSALRETAVFNIHRARRFYSGLRVGMDEQRGAVNFMANVSVFQTDQDGHSKLFVVGQYEGVLSVAGDSPRLEKLQVTLDTFTVPTLLAIPV